MVIFERMPRHVFKCIWEWICGKRGKHWFDSLVRVRTWSCGARGDGRRQVWVSGQSSTGSQCPEKFCLQVPSFYLAALQVPDQVLGAEARCCGTRGFSCVEQWTEFPAAVFQSNPCAWASVARCYRVLQLCAGSVSEPWDNFNVGIKEGLYCGLGMPATSFGSACVGKCSPSFAKKFFNWLFFLVCFFLMQPQTKTITFTKINMHPCASWGLGMLYAA